MGKKAGTNGRSVPSRVLNARNDIITGVTFIVSVLMFVDTGGRAMTNSLRAMFGLGSGVDQLLLTALTLNIALILFSWRRYRDLADEVIERASADERAQVLSSRDPLTGFYNRRALAEHGAALLASTTEHSQTLAMLMLDLDHFKNVNDVHGHAAGDALLRKVASEVTALLPKSAISARLGGDEFACIFAYDWANPEAVDAIAEAIVSRLAQPLEADGVHVHISVSVGIAHSDAECNSIDALTRRADIAMYAAKQEGRNKHAWFDASMEVKLQRRNDTEAGLRRGVPLGEFVPYFEQQIDLSTGRLHGFEMLARWNHPTRGVVGPEEFISIAEETGIIAELSLSIMRQALIEARNWDPDITVSVNISPVQLKDPWLAQKLVKLLTETGFPAERLEVEITESSLFENLPLAQSIVGSLKNQGIKLALDDFGTGYSSLAHLRALPFDRIKIDKSFVISILDNTESAAIVNAITRLGDSLGLPVTAEGIEDSTIEERLCELGCHRGQGWLYGKPLPIAQVRSLLAERNLLPSARVAPTPSQPVQTKNLRLTA